MTELIVHQAHDYAPTPCRRARDAKRPAGLVLSETSGTSQGSAPWHQVDGTRARLKRLKSAVITSARLHDESIKRIPGSFRHKAVMLTLTYRDDVAWQGHQISECIRHIRQWLKRRGVHQFRYVWVLELTKRGRPHYHAMFWLPKGLTLPKPDKQGWWKHGMTKIEWARRPVGYMAKYASKGSITDEHGRVMPMPSGAKLYSVGGLDDCARDEKAWWLSPVWVRDRWTVQDRPRRALGGGWMALRTGEWRPSPWEVSFERGKVYVRRLAGQLIYLNEAIGWDAHHDERVKALIAQAQAEGIAVAQYDGWCEPVAADPLHLIDFDGVAAHGDTSRWMDYEPMRDALGHDAHGATLTARQPAEGIQRPKKYSFFSGS